MGSNPVAAVVVVDEKPSVVNEASQPPVTPAPASAAATATSVTSEGNASNSRYEVKELLNLANRSILVLATVQECDVLSCLKIFIFGFNAPD